MKSFSAPVRDYMSSQPATLPSGATVGEAIRIMAQGGYRHLPVVDNGRLVFVYHDDLAQSVSLAGDFNDWAQQRTPLSRDKSGLWLAELPAPDPGRYRYKFVVDGHRWLEDPSNGMKVADHFGGLNSLLVIE